MIHLLTDILSAQLHQTALSPEIRASLTPEVLSKLYRLAERHDLAHIVRRVLVENGVDIPDALRSGFKKSDTLAVYRCAQQKQTLCEVEGLFDHGQIDYVPLKGAVLRSFYPTESMRVGCDVDVLVRCQDVERACEILVQAGYQIQSRNYHDVTLVSPTRVTLELHFTLRENTPSLDAVLERVWTYASPEKGRRHTLDGAFFVFQAYAHMSYHFLSGGCGLRSLMDIWVMEHKMGYSYLDAASLLEEAGVLQFAQEMTRLTHVCFDAEAPDDWTELLLRYILSGGIYGTMQNKIAMKKSERGGTVGYAFGRVFLPYETMKQIYPVLEKASVLLPFCWMHRFFVKLFTGKGRRAARELQVSRAVSPKKAEAVDNLRKHLGI